MKWDKPSGSTQHSSDGRYAIVQANSQDWIAYQLHATTGKDLGRADSDEKARELCESHSQGRSA
jgi:hypothetical protein